MFRLLFGLAIVSAGLPALAGTRPAPAAVTVFAAASLKESLDAIGADWTRRSGQKVVISYAGSSALARQIEQDAPADIFIPADREWMDYLESRKRIDSASRFDLVANRLVLIAPRGSPVRSVSLSSVAAFSHALSGGRLAVAETSSVPAGRYARQSLMALRLWQSVSPRLAQGDNVRAAMAFVARGEAPLGIVYATDAKAEPKVRVVAVFPQASHEPIIYPVARVASADRAVAQGFLSFLRGARARARFLAAGFGIP